MEIGALGTILSIKGQVAKLYLQGQGLDWGRRCGKWRAELELCSVVRYLIAGSSTDCCRGVTYTSTLLMFLPLPHTQKKLVTPQLDISREGRIGKATEGSNDLFSLLCHGRSVALGSIRHSSREMWSLQIVIGISSNKYWNSSPPNQATKCYREDSQTLNSQQRLPEYMGGRVSPMIILRPSNNLSWYSTVSECAAVRQSPACQH